jgi:RecA/RadA recombinase
MVASNQIRDNTNIGGISVTAPGGRAPGFYASLRLRLMNPVELRDKKTIHGREISRTYGISTEIKVFKSSVWKPFRTAKVFIVFDYGVDDIRANLQFIKDFTSNKIYTINGENLDKSMDASIKMIEEDSLENVLKEEVIDLWEEIEEKFKKERKPKKR